MRNLNEIMVKYAQERGGGLPLTAQEICNAVVLWVQDFINSTSGVAPIRVTVEDDKLRIYFDDTDPDYLDNLKTYIEDNFFNAFDLANLVEGSESIVVDVNETNDKIEIHLDADLVQAIGRAVLTPVSIPQVPSVPVLGVNGAIEWAPVSTFVGGGGKLYKHTVECIKQAGAHDQPPPTVFAFTVYTTSPTKFGLRQIIDYCRGAPALYETASDTLYYSSARSGVIAGYDGDGEYSDLHIFFINGEEFYADEFYDTVREL